MAVLSRGFVERLQRVPASAGLKVWIPLDKDADGLQIGTVLFERLHMLQQPPGGCAEARPDQALGDQANSAALPGPSALLPWGGPCADRGAPPLRPVLELRGAGGRCTW